MLKIPTFKAGLDCNEEVHQLVKNSNQDKVIWAIVGMTDKMKKTIYLNHYSNFLEKPQDEVLRMSSFLSKGLRLPKKLDLRRTSLAKSFAMWQTCHFLIHA